MKACKFCGQEVENTKKKCPSCGSTELVRVCDNCGEHFEGNFCPKCGVKVGQKGKTCPECQTVYYSNACPNCGYTPLRKTPSEQTIVHKHVYVNPPSVAATSTKTAAQTRTSQTRPVAKEPTKSVKKKSKWRWLLYFLAFCAVVSLFRGDNNKTSTKKSASTTRAPAVTATTKPTASPAPTAAKEEQKAASVSAESSTMAQTEEPTEKPTEEPSETPTPEPMDEMAALQAFYDDFSENGTPDNIKELAQKYGLYSDYYNTGTGRHKYKIAYTKKEAEAYSLSCFGQAGHYVEVEVNIWDKKISSVRFNKEEDYIKPEGDHYDESLKGRGYADSGRSEPKYVGVIGYVAVYGDQERDIEKAKDFKDTSLWDVSTYVQDKQFWNESGKLPHKTEVVVREQNISHTRYGNYTGYLLVEKTDDGSSHYINVKNFITKPYWTYQTDLKTAALTGLFIAEFKQVSDYYPITGGGKKANIPDGSIVLVTGTAGLSKNVNSSQTDIEALWGKSKYYFNHEDLTIIY